MGVHGGPVTAAPTHWPPDACAAPAPAVQTSISFPRVRGSCSPCAGWYTCPLCCLPLQGPGGAGDSGSPSHPQGQLGLLSQPWAVGSGDRPLGIKAVLPLAAAGSNCDSALVRGTGAAGPPDAQPGLREGGRGRGHKLSSWPRSPDP